ncbi:hypothetical protein G647_01974 [Cladophialophora carrionii CBS 160.54]|uniref:Cupin type-1 domain-containing protein n=1 Tax=Cladophialophora carrionii CBS 160.54 TaxID=1279043 RepID=V9DS95_9EURO|nr:uncharacterized protein G647_01974 [Cladophialophora carrionii CBS 160.54]ETI29521.1 hypothetical protein G647_01974 [Cladophialophora carrionii CBS 160.54]
MAKKVLSRLHQTRPAPADSLLPDLSSKTEPTLFVDWPEKERKVAIAKLHKLAAQQPASTTTRLPAPCPRRFKWIIFAMLFLALGFIAFAVVASLALAANADRETDLVAKLRMANTNLDRMKLLPDDSDWFFDFTKQDTYTFSPGGVINANAATFPATVGQGMTLAMLNLGPCSMLPPHFHPRATNFVVAISGTTQTYMIAENGARTVTEVLKAGQMTIFPTASVHTMMNIGCENAQLISSLNSDDSGTTNLANTFFSLPANITNTVIGGGLSAQDIYGRVPAVGTGSSFGPNQCRAACAKQGKMLKREW